MKSELFIVLLLDSLKDMKVIKSFCRFFSSSQRVNIFQHIEEAPADPIFGIVDRFLKDQNPSKVNLSIGVYRTEKGQPHVFKAVRKVEDDLAKTEIDKEFDTSAGDPHFLKQTKELVFGENAEILDRIASIQTTSGCCALKLVALHLEDQVQKPNFVFLEPTWLNHHALFKKAGNFYHINMYDREKNGFKIDEVYESLKTKVPQGSVVLLQACANNPTGIDPKEEHWMQISKVCKERNLLPLVDSAYLGFVTADFKKDSFLIRLLAEEGHEFFICQSFSKNMGLYGERLGALHVVCKDKEKASKAAQYFSDINAVTVGTPGSYSARVAAKVLGIQEYRNEWLNELQTVTQRMLKVRSELLNKLKEYKTPGNWEHIVNQCGLFTYIGLETKLCEELIFNKHVYILKTGRMCVAGLNEKNVDYVAKCLNELIK